MALTCGIHLAYVVHHFLHEEFVLGVMDFTTENMGWMLTWGNTLFVGCLFPLPTFYLAQRPEYALWWPCNVAIALVALIGLWMFSTSNLQKHQFRQDPTAPIWGAKPKSMKTKRGTELLLSGWWGIGRVRWRLGATSFDPLHSQSAMQNRRR